MKNLWLVIFISLLTIQYAIPAKILMIPSYHYSHVNLFSVAGKALVDENHHVVILTNKTLAKTPERMNLTTMTYEIPRGQTFLEKIEPFTKLKESSIGILLQAAGVALPAFEKVCHMILGDEKLMSDIKRESFDLVIIDGIPLALCFYVIPYKFNIPYITLTAVIAPWSAGVTGLPSVEPFQTVQTHNKMTFFQRLKTLFVYSAVYTLPDFVLGSSYVDKYAPGKPSVSISKIYRMSEIFLVNHDITCLDYPRVSAPNYVYIGGSSARAPLPLPDDVKEFVEGAEHGIIIMSFGSAKSLQNLWTTMKPKMVQVFMEVTQRALILYGFDDTHDFPSNVKAMNWLPQNDLLAHPKAKLFITHGGNNGQLEAAYHGVPMLVVPVVSDQMYNGIRAQHHGFGRVLPHGIETPVEELQEAVNDLLSNESYAMNIKKCSAIIKSMPSTQEKIVFWVEHILRFGGSHLRPASIDMSMFQVLMVDMMFFILVSIIVVAAVGLFCCRLCYRKCCKNRTRPKYKTE